MGLGDSITEGGECFQSYLFYLNNLLCAAGYKIEFVGPRISKYAGEEIHHCGFSGKSTEFLESVIDTIYYKYIPDIILLHSGHNHFNTEKPIDGIIKAQKSIIQKILTINPNAKIIVAKVILSGKLPKYSYIPKLNKRIEKMVKNFHNPNLFVVDQSRHFRWKKYTIKDKVHPNQSGAQHMAMVWFKSLQDILQSME